MCLLVQSATSSAWMLALHHVHQVRSLCVRCLVFRWLCHGLLPVLAIRTLGAVLGHLSSDFLRDYVANIVKGLTVDWQLYPGLSEAQALETVSCPPWLAPLSV